MRKLIFLDIDGVIIPETQFMFYKNPSYGQIFDDKTVRVLKTILDASGAQIVLNTTHNLFLDPDTKLGAPGLLNKLEEADLTQYLYRKEGVERPFKTAYPDLDRLTCIMMWLRDNPSEEQTLWVALDDCKIDHKRAFLVHPDHGLGIKAFYFCAQALQFKRDYLFQIRE